MRRPLTWTALLLSAALFSGCFPKAGSLPGPLAPEAIARAQGRYPGTTAESLERGRGLFVTYCDNCHNYPDRREYSEEMWPNIVRRMGKKASISAEDSDLVLHFVLAARAGEANETSSPKKY